MGRVRSLRRLRGFFLHGLAAIAVASSLVSLLPAQTAAGDTSQPSPEEVKKLYAIFGQMGPLLEKIRARVQFPPPRGQSRLLPMLPPSTILYAAFPNYGESAHQALDVFQEELKQNSDLQGWWKKGDMATEGPKIESQIEKFYQVSQYLGDEIVVSAAVGEDKGNPRFVMLAEVKKPGLKETLQQVLKDAAGKSKPEAQVFDPAEFAAAKSIASTEPVILVRPDLVVLAENSATLQSFNEQLPHPDQGFASTEFGQRMSKSYGGSTSVIAGMDLGTVLNKVSPPDEKNRLALERTGFSDVKYLVWEHSTVAGQSASQIEVSFTRPRRGMMSWLAAPGPLGSLDFVSPKAALAVSFLLKNPAEILDDVKNLATTANPTSSASFDQIEHQLNLSLRDDLFGRLSGEIAIEVDRPTPPNQTWKVFLKTNDSEGLQATLSKLFAAAQIRPGHFTDNGITYYTVAPPSAQKQSTQKSNDIAYAFADGFLIIASSREAVAEAIRTHRSGESLAKSNKFQDSLPPGSSAGTSGLIFQDSTAFAEMSLRRFAPDLADQLAQSKATTPASVVALYGDDNALRIANKSAGTDIGTALIVAAIAIPNVLRARAAANEASAVAMIRTVDVAQITYAASYPRQGYARNLASLGPDQKGVDEFTAQHAGIIDSVLGNPNCLSGAWCVKSGYRFSIVTACKVQQPCHEYVVVGSPVDAGSGARNFCATSDAVIRFQVAPPLTSPITAAECFQWAPLDGPKSRGPVARSGN